MNPTTKRFPRATRDDCLRTENPFSGPYRRASWPVRLASHRFVLAAIVLGSIVCTIVLIGAR